MKRGKLEKRDKQIDRLREREREDKRKEWKRRRR